MTLLEIILQKTEFLDVVKGKYILVGLIANTSIFAWMRVQINTLPENLTFWFTAVSAFCLALLGLRKIVRYIIRDWFPDSTFLKDK
jgi:hypothetical protein